jgi:hypothetical protein
MRIRRPSPRPDSRSHTPCVGKDHCARTGGKGAERATPRVRNGLGVLGEYWNQGGRTRLSHDGTRRAHGRQSSSSHSDNVRANAEHCACQCTRCGTVATGAGPRRAWERDCSAFAMGWPGQGGVGRAAARGPAQEAADCERASGALDRSAHGADLVTPWQARARWQHRGQGAEPYMVAAENSAGQARHARVCRSTHQIPLRLDVHSEVPTSAVCRCKPTAAAEISHRSRAPQGASTRACIATCADSFAARLERLYTYAAKAAEAEAKPRARVKQSVRMPCAWVCESRKRRASFRRILAPRAPAQPSCQFALDRRTPIHSLRCPTTSNCGAPQKRMARIGVAAETGRGSAMWPVPL